MCSVLENFVHSGYIGEGYKTKTPAYDHHENAANDHHDHPHHSHDQDHDYHGHHNHDHNDQLIITIVIIIGTLIGVWWGPSSPSPLQSRQTWQNTPSAPLQEANLSDGQKLLFRIIF